MVGVDVGGTQTTADGSRGNARHKFSARILLGGRHLASVPRCRPCAREGGSGPRRLVNDPYQMPDAVTTRTGAFSHK